MLAVALGIAPLFTFTNGELPMMPMYQLAHDAMQSYSQSTSGPSAGDSVVVSGLALAGGGLSLPSLPGR